MIGSKSPSRALAFVVLALAFLAGCSTTPNSSFCCSDPADCARFRVSDEKRECAEGRTCVGNTCIAPSCETDGCTASVPVCDVVTDVCGGCTTSADCAPFPDAQVCDTASGACIACVDAACPSGACADDGTCADDASVVYLHPQGEDKVPCSKDQPCKDLGFAVQQTNSSRTHIVFAPGNYTLPDGPLNISSQVTNAPRLSIHGGGATLTGGSADGFIDINIPTTLRDLEIVNPTTFGRALYTNVTMVVERARLRGYRGVINFGQTRLVDVDIRAVDRGISNAGTLTIDRATISGGAVGIESQIGSVDITNLLVSGTSGIGLDFTATVGSVAFSTITDTGTGGAGTPGMRCQPAQLNVRSTIIWTPANPLRVGIEGSCSLSSSIVGPVGVVGVIDADPVFMNPGASDYHLSGGSPARDMVDVGPATDFEGDPRPHGPRFDIGADEAP